VPTLEVLTKEVAKAATSKELTGTELAVKINSKLGTEYDGRSIGRALSGAVKAGKLVKTGPKSRPRYTKA
jgi:hypothetical protein